MKRKRVTNETEDLGKPSSLDGLGAKAKSDVPRGSPPLKKQKVETMLCDYCDARIEGTKACRKCNKRCCKGCLGAKFTFSREYCLECTGGRGTIPHEEHECCEGADGEERELCDKCDLLHDPSCLETCSNSECSSGANDMDGTTVCSGCGIYCFGCMYIYCLECTEDGMCLDCKFNEENES